MKLHLVFLLFLSLGASSLQAQDSDYTQIETTLNYYLQGGTNNDFSTLKKAFHESCFMKSIGDNFRESNALEVFEKAMKPGPKQNRVTQVDFIHISGNAASAKVSCIYPTFTFHDYMHLLKIEGEWKIVSKTFFREIHE